MSTNDDQGLPGGAIASAERTPHATEPGRSRVDAELPDEIARRYRTDGDRLLFPDGAIALERRSDAIIVRTTNRQVVTDALQIARAQGWTRVSIHGSEAFRMVARAEARQLGLALADDEPRPREVARPAESANDDSQGSSRADRAAADRSIRQPGASRSTRDLGATTTGTLIASGEAPYRFDSRNARSFFVRMRTDAGQTELWGTGLARALATSSPPIRAGDEISVRKTARGRRTSPAGADPARGRTPDTWEIERTEELDRRRSRAETLRQAVDLSAEHLASDPVLGDAALIMQAARVFASARLTRDRERTRFVEAVRQTLAATVEQGGRLPGIRLTATGRGRQEPSRPQRQPEPRQR
ncbi:MAG: hypothetical protein RJA99_3332 [Pseudomonadota bacterium]|jgi:hypothetical protein